MRRLTLALVISFGTLSMGLTSVGHAQPVCGRSYEIVRGDTLSGIAAKVFGQANRWLEIYEFGSNAARIGRNPNLLNVNTNIELPPCPQTVSSEAPVVTRDRPTPSQDIGFVPTIQIVTAGDYSPFTDETAPGRGMLTQVVEAAFSEADLPNEFEIDFINDWGSHLTILIPKSKYDMGFPWFKPDCRNREALPEGMRIRCDYVWSDPLYTVSIAFFAPVGLENPPTSFEELHGARICRPAGYYTFDLSDAGLYDGKNIELVRPGGVAECFTALERGEVDYVSLNRFTAERAIAREGLTNVVEPLETLVTALDLHIVAHRDNALASLKWMNAFNDGLRKIHASGMFGRITGFHIGEHRKALAELKAR